MITKSDWQAVQEEMAAEERRKLGEPPVDELLAFSRGELAAEDAERVRAWLVCNPEEARALVEPFPADDARPGDRDHLSEHDLARRWASFKKEVHGPAAPQQAARVVRFPMWTGLAAALALVFAGLYWQQRQDVERLSAPHLLDVTQQLLPEDGRRGPAGAAPLLDVSEDSGVRELMLTDASRFQWYRLEIVDAASKTPLWRSEPGQLVDDRLLVFIPRTYLKPGTYRIEVYGLDGTRVELVDSYRVRVGQ